MNFKEIKPSRNRSRANVRDKIRVSFPELKDSNKKVIGNTMLMYIGIDVCNQVGLKGGDKVRFYVDETNPRIWFVKKSDNDVGYKAMEVKKPSGKEPDILRVQLTWKEYKPNQDEITVKTVKHELYQGGIRIFLN